MATSTIRQLYTRPRVRFRSLEFRNKFRHPLLGELVATHRKVHLFDIDIPGKIRFKVACIREPFAFLSHRDSGKRDAYWWLNHQLF